MKLIFFISLCTFFKFVYRIMLCLFQFLRSKILRINIFSKMKALYCCSTQFRLELQFCFCSTSKFGFLFFIFYHTFFFKQSKSRKLLNCLVSSPHLILYDFYISSPKRNVFFISSISFNENIFFYWFLNISPQKLVFLWFFVLLLVKRKFFLFKKLFFLFLFWCFCKKFNTNSGNNTLFWKKYIFVFFCTEHWPFVFIPFLSFKNLEFLFSCKVLSHFNVLKNEEANH